MALKEIYEYFRHYDKETYQVVACMGNESSEEDVQDFENQYGIRLPEDFREFTMSSLGGLFMEVREDLWPRDIRIKTKELHDLGFVDYIPFLSIIGDGDVIFCFDKDNHIVALDWFNSGETEELECDFSELLLQQIAELEERKNEMVKLLEKGKSSQ